MSGVKDVNLLKRTKQRRQEVSKWIKEHRVELSIGAGILVFTGIGIAVGLKCKNQQIASVTASKVDPISDIILAINSPLDEVPKNINCSPKSPHVRNGHVRNLVNKKASSKKIEEAFRIGIPLLDNQTYVKQSFVHAS